MIRPDYAPGRLALGLLAAAMLWAGAAPVRADGFQSCSQQTEGRHSCSDGTICVCTALPADAPRIGNGYYWDCSSANGTCGEARGGISATLDIIRPKHTTPAPGAVDTLSRADAARLQARLNTLGFDAGPADGVIGPRTREAIRSYEAKKGYMVDGLATNGLLLTVQ